MASDRREVILSKAALRVIYDRHNALVEGLHRFIDGEQYKVSSGIDGSTTYGYGELDENGFWQFPIPEGLARLRRENNKLWEIIELYKKNAIETNEALEEYLKE